ncbi:Hpt domain-containing protein [candidate division KSB1 bacterium]
MQEIQYDLSNLMEFAAGDEHFIKEMLEFFIKDTPDALNKLKDAVEENDYEKIYQISHKFSSQLSLVAIEKVSILMNEIEKTALAKTDLGSIQMKVSEATSACLYVIDRIKKDYNL